MSGPNGKSEFWDKFGWVVIFDIGLVVLLAIVVLGYLGYWPGFRVQV